MRVVDCAGIPSNGKLPEFISLPYSCKMSFEVKSMSYLNATW